MTSFFSDSALIRREEINVAGMASQQQQQPQPQQQQYCLKWNNHTNNMVKVFNELLGDENFVDVTLACDGVSIKAHKLVLSACSTYFRDLFINNPCKHPIVILKDIHYEDLRAIIHFMYSGEVNVSCNQLGPLLKAAEALKVKGLTDVNEKHGRAFFNGTTNNGSNHHSDSLFHLNGDSQITAASQIAANLQLYNRLALESLTNSNQHGSNSNDASITANAGHNNPYLALMAQRLKKRRRKHNNGTSKNNGSALALANVLQASANGTFNPLAAAAAAAALTNGFASPNKLSSSLSPNNLRRSAINITNNNSNSNSNHSQIHSNGNNNHPDDYQDDDRENCQNDGISDDEESEISTMNKVSNSNKKLKECNSSSDTINNDNGTRSPHHQNNNTQDDDEEEEEDEMEECEASTIQQPSTNGESNANENDENAETGPPDSMMMSMHEDSDEEFYNESPSPSNSTMDDNSSFNSSSFASAVGPILENSLTGSNLPNSSTKVCVCHLCHLTFTAYSSLRRHMTRHFADRERYECDICLKSYSRKDYLKEHKKLKHSDVAKVLSAQRGNKSAANSVS